MKPQKLIMSAFGSYAGEVVIDFSNISHGIFLITGDTGAGKTTIFDAICYALYDRTSGGAREASDIICEEIGCEGIQAIGNKLVVYKQSKKKPQIELPQAK